MSHLTRGLYRLLEYSGVYERLQSILGGGGAARGRFVQDFVRPSSGARILDIGCGTGSLLHHLPAEVRYVGYDLNERYIATARERYGERGRFFCARVGEDVLEPDAVFDIVIAKAILHHLNDEEAEQLVSSAHAHVRPGGALVTIDPVYHEGQSRIARAIISRDRGRGVRTPDGYRRFLERLFTQVEGTLVTDLLVVPYSHWVMRAFKVPPVQSPAPRESAPPPPPEGR